MKFKRLLTILLLVFVGANAGFLIYKENGEAAEKKQQSVQSSEIEIAPVTQSDVSENIGKSPSKKDAGNSQNSDHSGKQPLQSEASYPGNKPETAGQITRNPKVVAYYFHTTMRCVTCKMIEDLSRVALLTGFPDEIKNGRLEFKAVNIEEPANQHFLKDYQLITRSLVLVRFEGEKQEKWKTLERVWDLVDKKEEFEKYVKEETKNFLTGI